MNRHVKKVFTIFKYPKKDVKRVCEEIEKYKKSSYIVFYNPECVGITNATQEILKNTISLNELFNEKAIEDISQAIVENNIKQVIFATQAHGYKTLSEKIKEKNQNMIIKFMWHGSHSLFVNRDEEHFLESILDLEKRGIVTSIGFLKESMAKFYSLKGYRSCFVMNTVNSIKSKKMRKGKNDKSIRVGIYSSGDRWEKNTYNQLSACSIVSPDLIVDSVPATPLFKSYCKLMNIKCSEESNTGSVLREELIERMSKNTVNLYVTFTECAPMVPLESLESGVPCIVGDNNHYFTDTELEKYLVVKSEDSIDEIAEKMKLCIEHRDEILKLYKEWKKEYDVKSKKSVEEFLKMK
ncbi:MAG: hypothetical protein Q4D02_05230 [Clostridia bacterium]|nr:hypothetical protein [Clostridia bacterium]